MDLPVTAGPVDLCWRDELEQDVGVEDRWIPWRSGDAVDPQLEIVSQAFEPAGLLCDLGSNQLSWPNGFLVELTNPPVSDPARYRSRRR